MPDLDGRVPSTGALTVGYDDRGGNTLIVELFTPEGTRLMRLVNPRPSQLKPELEKAFDSYNRTRKEFLDYLFSFRPVTADDREQVGKRIEQFSDNSIDVREEAGRRLVAMGRPAWVALKALDLDGRDEETKSRVAAALLELRGWNELVESGGLDHDLGYLARHSDARAYERLKKILSGVRPFSVDGVPERGPALDQYLRGWWDYSKSRVSWNADTDRFEPK